MQLSFGISCALPLLWLGFHSSAAKALEAPLEGYGVVDLTWELEVIPGKPPQTFNGTVEQVVAEAVEINPQFLEDYGLDKPLTVADTEAMVDAKDEFQVKTGEDDNGKRDFSPAPARRWADPSEFSVKCNGRWVQCSLTQILDGYRYLWKLKGKPTNGPGPGNCGRVSCSYDSAIWWCNDSKSSKTLSSWKSIAGGVEAITDKCTRYFFPQNVAGQAFHKTQWNVIVRADNC